MKAYANASIYISDIVPTPRDMVFSYLNNLSRKARISTIVNYSFATLLEKPQNFFYKENRKSLTKATAGSII